MFDLNMSSNNYACACLNVSIRPHLPLSSTPPTITHPDYRPIYVGEQGISIVPTLSLPFFILYSLFLQVHPQLTLRTRTHSRFQSTSEPLLRRYTSLTCLICRMSVYRVLQFIPPDLDPGEGPVLPTEEWVEQEILQSESGWIELTKLCLVSPLIFCPGHKSLFLSFSPPIFRGILLTSQLIQRQMNQWLCYKLPRHIHPCFV
jgi:hypothetical protein